MQATLTIDPHGDYPVTLPAEDYDTICNAIGLRGLGRKIGETKLDAFGTWTFTVGDDGYRMTVA